MEFLFGGNFVTSNLDTMAHKSFSLASKVKVSSDCCPERPGGQESNLKLTSLQLNNGLTMPQIHLGVYLMSGKEAHNAVGWALDVRSHTPISYY